MGADEFKGYFMGDGESGVTRAELDEGRRAFQERRWRSAFGQLSMADAESPLGADDLELLASAAYLSGRDDESIEALTRAHQNGQEMGDVPRAARCAFWIGFQLMNRGEHARGSGWLTRAGRLLEDGCVDCVERGYVLLPRALRSLGGGDPAAALRAFDAALDIGERFGDVDLCTLGRLGRGQALLKQGDVEGGVALLDEAMVAVEADEVSPIVSGIVYCAVIEACQEIFDLGRAGEWTAMMADWCERQPDLAPFRGQCLARRAEIMCLRGDWEEAMAEAMRASVRLTEPPGEPAAGLAFYQQAELLRLRGEYDHAEEVYQRASEWGKRPQPGLALLRLAQGDVETALIAVRRVVEEVEEPIARAHVLPAYVEIALAAGDLEEARSAADELAAVADEIDAPLLRARAAHARGCVCLEDGDARAALRALRQACQEWEQLEAPYEAARARESIAAAYRQLGDEDTARMELIAARRAYEQLGAVPDLARTETLLTEPDHGDRGDLTEREMEVLRLVAAGRTNKGIGEALFISERTVERHVSNIFNKLGVSSRAAATAHAYEHHLI